MKGDAKNNVEGYRAENDLCWYSKYLMDNVLTDLFDGHRSPYYQRPPEGDGYLAEVSAQWNPLKPTEVFATYWYFAAARQDLFFNRVCGANVPWTSDPILAGHRFTNAYRASDRVSQYLIRHIISSEESTSDFGTADIVFRVLLFKFFNKIETWQLLERHMEEVSWRSFSFEKYNSVLTAAMERGEPIFSAAYIMPSGQTTFNEAKKHRNFLRLLESMMKNNLAKNLLATDSLDGVYQILRGYPLLGKFLAYQYAIDLNYWEALNYEESSFVVAGPGARDGIAKCFTNSGIYPPEQVIKMMAERQQHEFDRLGIKFRDLWGRRLQLIDCQNLFCEVDKYSRVAHPSINGLSKRTRIKQVYRPVAAQLLPTPYYPPKWGINDYVRQTIVPRSVQGGI